MPWKVYDGPFNGWSQGPANETLADPVSAYAQRSHEQDLARRAYPNRAERIVRTIRDAVAIVTLGLTCVLMIWVLVVLASGGRVWFGAPT